jgi:glycosyltransferase involved in cell wall biosynthesis
MLAVVERLRDRSDVTFLFIGGGSQSAVIQTRLEQGDLPNCRWIEWIDHDQIPLAWVASHVTFWAMRDEALYHGTIPAKLYEALASGTPIVAAHTGEGAKMITESGAGFTVKPGDADGLIGAIERLLDEDDFHRQCSQSGRAYAEAHFDPEQVASAYEAVLVAATRRWRKK